MKSEDGSLRLSNKKLLEELEMLWWAYHKEQIWFHLAGPLVNELHLAHMMCFLFMSKTDHPEPLKHLPAAHTLHKPGKVRQEDIYL